MTAPRLILFALACVITPIGRAGETRVPAQRSAYSFRGIVPGRTTLDQLRLHPRWGEPTGTERGSAYTTRVYRIRGYQEVTVAHRGQTILWVDAWLPAGVSRSFAVETFELGEPVDHTQPTLAGPDLADEFDAQHYSAGRVVLYSKGDEARVVRTYGPEQLKRTRTLSQLEPSATGPDERARSAVEGVVRILSGHHYSGQEVGETILSRCRERVIAALDATAACYTAEDIERLRAWHDDAAHGSEASFVYEAHRTLLDRVDQRVAWTLEMLDIDHDFTVDETAPARPDYPTGPEDARERWRKRIKNELLTCKLRGETERLARTRIERRYVAYRERLYSTSDDALLDVYLSALCASFDRHTSYVSPTAIRHELISAARFGVGVDLRQQHGEFLVAGLQVGGPAELSGQIGPGDQILAVGSSDGWIDPFGMRAGEVEELLRGERGTVVRLQLLPEGATRPAEVELARDAPRTEDALARSEVLVQQRVEGGRSLRVGYIELPRFYVGVADSSSDSAELRSSSGDVRRLLEQFRSEPVDVVLLDLRRNRGGPLEEANSVSALFTGGGPMGQARSRSGRIQVHSAPDVQAEWNGPLVVFTSRRTASSAELCASAVKDYGRALLVGDSATHGLGGVRQTMDVAAAVERDDLELGAVKVIYGEFFRLNGQSLQAKGVASDVVLSERLEWMHRADEGALFAGEVEPAEYQMRGRGITDRVLVELSRMSSARRQAIPGFQDLARRAGIFKRRREQQFVSLNEERRRAEIEAAAGRESSAALEAALLQEAMDVTLDYLSDLWLTEAKRIYRLRQYDEAFQKFEEAVQAAPNYSRAHYSLAWARATCPAGQHRDGDAAILHATRACELSQWSEWSHIFALAVAEAEAGHFEDAAVTLKLSLQIAPLDKREEYGYLQDRFESRRTFAAW